MKVIIQPGNNSRETVKAWQAARTLGVDCVCKRPELLCRQDRVAVGDVDFCEHVLSLQGVARPVPDFYPDFLSGWMRRLWTIQRNENPAVIRTFVKSAESYKSFPARIVEPGEMYPAGMLYISEVVQFVQEWRYYVADGAVVTSGWYDGDNEDEPAPDLAINWPPGFCGAVDFGRLSSGEIALVECHHPYACGWYGDDHELYLLWLIEGWQWMLRKGSNQ